MDTVNSALNRAKFSINAKCGTVKIYGLRLEFSNSNFFSHTSLESYVYVWTVFVHNLNIAPFNKSFIVKCFQ